MSTFVDTSIWFAAAAKTDRSNELAKSILSSVRSPIITDHVLSETWQLLKASFGKQTGDLFWERLRQTGIRPEPVKEADIELAWHIGKRFPDFSFVDRISFAFMELRSISEVATLASDVNKYRYGARHERSFRILNRGQSLAFKLLSQAAREHKTVRLIYKGKEQIACPYLVGETNGEERAFAALGDGSWVCLVVAQVEDVELIDEPWVDAQYPGTVQRCVDTVFVDSTRAS